MNAHVCDRNGPATTVVDESRAQSRAGIYPTCSVCGVPQVFGRTRGLAAMGLTVNAPYVAEWADKIGRFILNFAGIELVSYQHLLVLEATDDAFRSNIGNLFANRADRITSLLATSPGLSDEERATSIDRWAESKELAKYRNRVAHNPVLPTWYEGSDSDRDPPDLLGIPDIHQAKHSMSSNSIQMDLLIKLGDHAADLGQRLHEVSIWLQRASRSPST